MQQRQFDIRECQPDEGINYAIPLDWWKLYCSCRKAHGTHANKYGSLGRMDPRPISDSLILDCEEYYLDQLAEKSTYMNLTRRLLCPQLLSECHLGLDYQLVNCRFYETLESSLKPVSPVIVFALKEKDYKVAVDERVERANGLIVPTADRLIQLILCTNRMSSLVICYLPSNIDLTWGLGQILKLRKLARAPETRVVFIDENKQASLPMQTLEGRMVRSLKDTETVIMLINLLSVEEEPKQQQQPTNNVVGYQDFLGSEPQQPNNSDNKTESTGASTLLELSGELSFRHDHQHMMEIIREKSPEQIEEMKLMARAAIDSTDLIMVRDCTQLQAEQQLAIIADKIMEIAVTAHKKKFKELKEK